MKNWFQRVRPKVRPEATAQDRVSGQPDLGGHESAMLVRDRGLLRRWRDGDRNAGLELLDHYATHERVVAFRLGVRSPDALLELHQELVLRMLDQLPTLAERIATSFAGWLAWQVRDLARARRRREVSFSEHAMHSEPAAPDAWERSATWEAILACRDRLPERERAVFELRYQEGLSLLEVAERLSSNANAVAQSTFRLVRRMRACLLAQGIEFGEATA
jgi:RNA polymerase sigma factor (sigma-70 family)